jgi:hypothetical protein
LGQQTDILSWPASQRSAHYNELSAKLRRMAEIETVPKMRAQLLALANQYRELAMSLRDKPLAG